MNIRRYIAIGDVHGQYDLLVELVEKVIRFNHNEDKLVFLGDYIDRGPKSRKVVEYLATLRRSYPDRVILLKGNHEQMAELSFAGDLVERREWMANWFYNGGKLTAEQYDAEEICSDLLPFIKSLHMYHTVKIGDESVTCVHAGLPNNTRPEEAMEEDMLWLRNYDSYVGQKIVIGHTGQKEVKRLPCVTMIDTGAFMPNGKLTGYDILADKVYEAKELKINDKRSR